MELLIVFWILIGLVVAAVARSKGREGLKWFVYALVIWPIALIHVLVINPTAAAVETHDLVTGARVKCPFCAEAIKPEAKVCPHCQREITLELKSKPGRK